MTSTNVNVQDVLLLGWQTKAVTVRMTMISGEVIEGVVKKFDRFAVLLGAGEREVLIYKHAISSLEALRKG